MTVDVPLVGTVDFPDNMSQEDVRQAVMGIHQKAVLNTPGQVVLPSGERADIGQGFGKQRVPEGLFINSPRLGALSPIVQVNPDVEKLQDPGALGFLEGVGKGVAGLASGATIPGFAAVPAVSEVPGIGPAALKVGGVLLGANMARQTVQQLGQGVTAPRLGEAVVNLPVSALMMGEGVAGLRNQIAPQSPSVNQLPPNAFGNLTVDDIYRIRSGQQPIDVSRQLPNRQTFEVAPMGQTIHKESVSPGELQEFRRLGQAQQRRIEQVGEEGAVSVPSQPLKKTIEEVTGVSRPKMKVRGPTQFPEWDKNQELAWNQIWTSQAQKAGIGNFYVKVGNELKPVQSLQDATETFTTAARRAKLTPKQLAKKGPFTVINRMGVEIGEIDANGKFQLRGFEGGPKVDPTKVPNPPKTGTGATGSAGPPPMKIGQLKLIADKVIAEQLLRKAQEGGEEPPPEPTGPPVPQPKPGPVPGAPQAQTPPPEPQQATPAAAGEQTAPGSALPQEPDYANMRGTAHPEGVKEALRRGLTEKDVPELLRQQREANNEMVQRLQKNPNDPEAMRLYGKSTYLGGMLEGARRQGPNYEGVVRGQAGFSLWDKPELRHAIANIADQPTRDAIARYYQETGDEQGTQQRIQNYASRKSSTTGVPSSQVRTRMDEGAPLRQQGQAPPVQAQQQKGQVPKGTGQAPSPAVQKQGVQRPGGGESRLGGGVGNAKTPSAGLDIQKLRPAIRMMDGSYRKGLKGQTHNEVIKMLDLKPEDIDRRGFLTDKGEWVDREDPRLAHVPGEPTSVPGAHATGLAQVQEQGKGIGGGIAKALEKNKGDESGMIDLRGVVSAFNDAKQKFLNGLNTRDNKKDIMRAKDAADTATVIAGQRARTGQEALAKVLFGPVADRALNATTAAIEANGDPKALDRFIAIATAKGDAEGLANAKFAKANWKKLQPLVNRADAWHDMVYKAAKNEGVDIDKRQGYIRHLYDLTKLPQTVLDKFFGGPSGLGGRGYKKERVFNTLYDAIEAGYGPAIRSWNSADLLENRTRTGLQEVNDLQWAKSFSNTVDPTTKKPIISLTEKPGYTPFNQLGPRFYVHRGYDKVFDAAVAASAIRNFEVGGQPIGEFLMKGVGTAKHSLLMFDTYHMFRMGENAMAFKGNPAYKKGLALLEYNPSDLKTAVQAGEITQDMADWANANRSKANLLIKNGFNVGRVQEAIDSDVVRKLNVLYSGTANKWIFEKMTRGAMLESGVREFDRMKRTNPQMTDEQVAKKVSRDLNFAFGNIGRQGVLRSKTAQDLARLVFLSPGWVESMAQTELRSIGQAGKFATTGKLDPLARRTGIMLLAAFVGAQVSNLISTGHPTWDNPENHKVDAFVPSAKPGGQGYYVSPFSVPMEITHDIIRYHNKGETPLQIGGQIVGNKLAPGPRALTTLISRRDFAGRPLTDTEAEKLAAEEAFPLPLAGQAAIRPGGDVQRQAMAMAGVKGEPAGTPRELIGQLSRQFDNAHNIKRGIEPQSDYAPLLKALHDDKLDDAKKEYEKLKATRKTEVIDRYFEELPNRIYEGSKEREQQFYNWLSDANKKDYELVRSQNRAISEEYFSRVAGHMPKMTKPRRRFSAFPFEQNE